MVEAITHGALWEDTSLKGYDCAIALVPADLPYNEAIWESDDRSITVANTSGSLWFRYSETGAGTPIAIATFAADDTVVRCDSITVDEPHRCRGIANHAYRLAACIFEAPVVPSSTQLAGGVLFWHGRTSIVC